MADKFDRYREALVVETATVWPDEKDGLDKAAREEVAKKLQADAAECTALEYVRVPTGFCRKITVTADDIKRVQ